MPSENQSLHSSQRLKHFILGAPRNINDPNIFHKISLIPVLAWIGLGADGLSSSSYGPEEAFRSLGQHTYLAIFLALATVFTVFIISYTYSKVIEHFPGGGGGYIVATHMIGEKTGVISGAALIVDYVLTITVSIASCSDAIFSYIPVGFERYKVLFSAVLIVLMVVINIRGIKESITGMAPIFITFLITHVIFFVYGFSSLADQTGPMIDRFNANFNKDVETIGTMGIVLIFMHAYSLGAGTYTGIEAVSNGIQIMSDPKVRNGKKTMVYMAISLAITASSLFVLYLLAEIKPLPGRTLNAVLADRLFEVQDLGKTFAVVTIFSEGALLLVGAQAGFIDAPRVMANMAVDSWLPHRFAAFSERLTMQNGVIMVGGAALAFLFYTNGSISALVVMYSINVFLTFSLSQYGMARFFFTHRNKENNWKKDFTTQVLGLILCLTILGITIFEKFIEGGWVTLILTSVVIILCYLIRKHYLSIRSDKKRFDDLLTNIPTIGEPNIEPVDPMENTAIVLIDEYNGFGVHTFLTVIRQFPDFYKNFIFVSVVLVDQGLFKGKSSLEEHKAAVRTSLEKYVSLVRRLGLKSDYRMDIGTDVIESGVALCVKVNEEFTKSMVFSGKLAFRTEKFYHKLLHNETAFAIQRILHWQGVPNMILPIKMDL
ncbi:Amino acid permease [Gammaproteobacteria bacterium]